MSRERLATVWVGGCFPRVSGDEPHAFQATAGGLEFSPRERG